MKTVTFIKSYHGLIPEGTKTNVSDNDFNAWLGENYVQEIEFEKGLGVYIKSITDIQIAKRNKENYHKAKLMFGETYLIKNQDDLRCDIVSNYIIDEYKIKTIRDAKCDEFWYDLNGVYVPNGKSIILETAFDFFGKNLHSAIISKIELLTKAKTFVEPSLFFGNVDKNKIGVANGILNLKTYELETNKTNQGNIFVRIPVIYDKTKRCPHFEEFLGQILETSQHVNAIQELLGFCLVPNYTYEKLFIFTGKGRNGKSKLITMFKTLLGPHNCAAHSLQTLQMKEYCVADLHNKLANIGGDISNDALKSVDIIKQITGQDLISANRKFKDYVHFTNYAKQIFACNELPLIYDSSLGFWNRINRIDFPYTFYEAGEFEKVSDELKPYAKVRDENVLEKLINPEELSGILNFALQGLLLLRGQKEFSNAQETEVIRSQWIRKTSSFYAYVSDLFEFDTSAIVNAEHINDLYDRYCEYYTLQQVQPNQRLNHIREFSGRPVMSTVRKDDKGDNVRVWKGIKLREEYDNLLRLYHNTLETFNKTTADTAITAVFIKIDFQKIQKQKSETDVVGVSAVAGLQSGQNSEVR